MNGQQAITWPDPDRDPAVRVNDPDTCVQPSEPRMSKGRWQALTALWWRGPSTDFELADVTGTAQTSIGKRRGELVKAGLVEATSERRPSPSGSPAVVWRLTGAGRDFYRDNGGERP